MKGDTTCPQPCVLYIAQHTFHSQAPINHTMKDKWALWHVSYMLSIFSVLCNASFHSCSLAYFLPSFFTCPGVVLTFPLFISSTGTTICGWPWPHWVVPQARTHVIIIQSNIRRVEKDCHDHKYTSFALGLAELQREAHTNPSSWLSAWSVK